MGLLRGLFEERGLTGGELLELLAGDRTQAGVNVTVEGSLALTAVWACVRVLAESVAQLPYILYRRQGQGKERALEHPLYRLLKQQPNPEMTSFELRELRVMHVATWGNSYAEIDWGDDGQVRGLWPLRPDRMKVVREGGQLWYDYRLSNEMVKRLPAYRISHWRGLGDGVVGWSPVRMHMESIGLAFATQEYGSRFFSNGARPGGVLTHPGKLSDEAYKRLKASMADGHQGLSNAHRMKVLEEGMTYQQVGIPPEEAQFLETRKFQRSEIASVYRVPPHMIGDLERATFSNIEHQSIDFVVHTLGPWLKRIEQADERDLFVGTEVQTLTLEHLVEGLLRGDTLSRYQSYQLAIQSGWMNRNEARRRENLNPADGLDNYLEPLNMAPAGSERASAVMESRHGAGWESRAEPIGAARQALAKAQMPLIEDVAERVVRRETNDVRRAVQKYVVRGGDVQGFLLWLGEFYGEHGDDFVPRQFGPVLTALGRLVLGSVAAELGRDGTDEQEAEILAFVAEYVASMGARWAASSRGQLEALIRETAGQEKEQVAAVLEERLAGWEATEPAKVGRREAWRALNAFAKAGYVALGVQFLRWVASGKSCDYCSSLNGKIVGVREFFVKAGVELAPDSAAGPLRVRRDTGHPPVHDGCDCFILAA